MPFQHLAAELRVYSGADSLASLARELQRVKCCRAVIVSGKSVARSEGMQLLREALGSAWAGAFDGVRSHSPLPAIEEAARALANTDADAVIAVGGGSAAVTARAAAILLAERQPARALCTRRLADGTFESPRLPAIKLPQFGVLTTPSTAFVKAGSAVLDPDNGERVALFDPKTRARALFLHPAFLSSAPSELVKSAGLNTLSTAVEALESPRCDPISEALLRHALRLTADNLGRPSTDDPVAREQLATAALLCGRGTEQAGGGLASVLAHAIGHRTHVANGLVNAIVLPHTIRFNAPATAGAASRITESLLHGSASGSMQASPAFVAQCIESLFARLGLPRRLRDIGVEQDELTPIAHAAMADWFIGRGPRRVQSHAELLTLLEGAW
ncbi:iron-containing alcohol dehydrogenase family protein [Variovorax sp. Sphag1AA]|uniref:iron-containing alcohol dehydrogenase family protein n=1 Tax=Variovorax sp. Sphag1AA TaxID=2587027 RepID=UPI00161A9C7A|nr:iron-containing alcohol dehydrogenase family protein [Variovorax sp. Sphag1AA]MBB3181124.1 alcohol dehydrogenase class IV [Variovorax sp. Sphag1AA]